MKGINRVVFALLVVVVAGAAVLAGVGLNLFYAPPEVTLPPIDTPVTELPTPTGTQGGNYIRVELTPDTVQSAIATLSRPLSYGRSVTVEYWWEPGASAVTTARVAVDGGWTAVEAVLPDGRVEHTLVGEEMLYRWYQGEVRYYSGPAERETADLSQRLPTYEDVLMLDKTLITETRYEERDGLHCVYLEVCQPELDFLERFWVAVNTGLLVAAETVQDGALIYRMTTSQVEAPVERGVVFSLPDGTVMHIAGLEG